jgi:hypothetical protein
MSLIDITNPGFIKQRRWTAAEGATFPLVLVSASSELTLLVYGVYSRTNPGPVNLQWLIDGLPAMPGEEWAFNPGLTPELTLDFSIPLRFTAPAGRVGKLTVPADPVGGDFAVLYALVSSTPPF